MFDKKYHKKIQWVNISDSGSLNDSLKQKQIIISLFKYFT